MAICHRAELRVYNHLGGGTPVVLPATSVKWSWGLGGEGFLSFKVDSRAEPIASNPRLLDDCVVKVAIPLTEPGTTLTEVAAYAVRGRSGTLWTGSGGQDRSISGAPSLFTAWSQDAILHPESNEIAQMDGDQRYFGWMSTIYNPAIDAGQWSAPTVNPARQDSTTGDRAGNPDGWPTELGGAYWITRGATANGTRHLFIADCVVPTDCYLTVYHSSDESTAVYFGGALAMQTSSSETGYLTINTWSAWVTAGTYRVAIDKTSVVSRGGDGRDPVLLAVATNTDTGDVDDILLVTNTSDWKIYTTDPDGGTVPSLTPGAIVYELHKQAKDRGVATWSALTLDFSGTVDSSGAAWPVREERAWRIAYDRYLDMIEGLGDISFCPEITPGLVLRAWANRGTDRSGTVTLATLDEISSVTEDGAGIAASYMAVETQDGWVIVQNADAAASVGRRETSLSLGNAPSIAQGKRLGQKVLDDRLSKLETERTIKFYARSGSVPFQDFNLGDTIGITTGASTTKGVVLDLSADQSSVESIIAWTARVSGDGVAGETRTGRFSTEPANALAEGATGSLIGDGGAALFSTTQGSAVASGGVGSLVGIIGGGGAIFSTTTGTATASGASASLTGAGLFSSSVGSAVAGGEVGDLRGDSAVFAALGVGEAAASGGVGSLVGSGAGNSWENAVVQYDWSDWVLAYELDMQGDMADDTSILIGSEVWG